MFNYRIKDLVKSNIRNLRGYEAREVPYRIKLDANESPYGLREWDCRKIARLLRAVKTNRYPDPGAEELKRAAGKTFGVSPDSILTGNGSDELIYYLTITFGGPVLYPVPTFSMYGIIAQALGEQSVEIPLDRAFDIEIERMLKAVKRESPKLIFLSSPNNPTGNCFSVDRIMRIIEKTKGIVIVDEAYQPFSSKKGFLPLLGDYKNLAIMRTMSKVGLAGLRVGFLIADAEIISEVNKVRLPFNLNSISQAIAVEALKDRGRLDSNIKKIISERGRIYKEMGAMSGIEPFPSEANFILFKVRDPEGVYNSLLKKGILVRDMSGIIKGCLRVTVGRPAENTAFLKALKEAVSDL